MAGVWRIVRAEARRRHRSWILLAALLALVGGTVLAGAAAARRTESAFPDYEARYGYDAVVYATSESLAPEVAKLPDVRSLVAGPFYPSADIDAEGQLVPPNATFAWALPSRSTDAVVKLTAGRLPRAANEILIGYSLQQALHLHLGTRISIPFYAPSQAQEVFDSNGTPAAHGPEVVFRVVGIAASAVDFPGTMPSYTIVLDSAFASTIGRHTAYGLIAYVRLRGGARDIPRFQYELNHLKVPPGGFAGAEQIDTETSAIESSIHPQVVGWWVISALAALAGIALIAQALSRQSVIARDANPTLSALGVRPSQLFLAGVLRAGAIGILGAVGGLALATALSPLTPVGEARIADPSTGVGVDPVVFGIGGIAIVVVALLLGSWPAWRDAQAATLRRREERVRLRSSRIADAVAHSGAPITAAVGVRHALERGRGRNAVPVATALLGVVAGVGALVASSVFGASMSTLLSTPRLYGQNFQLALASIPGGLVRPIANSIAKTPGVTDVTYAYSSDFVSVNGVSVETTLAAAQKGPLIFSLSSGHEPQGTHEIALGSTTLRQVHAKVGSMVKVTAITGKGTTATGEFRVVGSGVFPPSISQGGLGVGLVVPISGAVALVCSSGATAGPCQGAMSSAIYSPQNSAWGIAVRVVPGKVGRAVVAALERRYASYLQVIVVPTSLVNFGQAVNFPLLLGIALALFGTATLLHLLLASASRRRRELALLKVIGFERRQVRASVTWQAVTVCAIGIVFGVPIGIAVGRSVWLVYTSNLGAVPLAVISPPVVLAIVAGVLLGGVGLAVLPASLAARAHPAAALREE